MIVEGLSGENTRRDWRILPAAASYPMNSKASFPQSKRLKLNSELPKGGLTRDSSDLLRLAIGAGIKCYALAVTLPLKYSPCPRGAIVVIVIYQTRLVLD